MEIQSGSNVNERAGSPVEMSMYRGKFLLGARWEVADNKFDVRTYDSHQETRVVFDKSKFSENPQEYGEEQLANMQIHLQIVRELLEYESQKLDKDIETKRKIQVAISSMLPQLLAMCLSFTKIIANAWILVTEFETFASFSQRDIHRCAAAKYYYEFSRGLFARLEEEFSRLGTITADETVRAHLGRCAKILHGIEDHYRRLAQVTANQMKVRSGLYEIFYPTAK